MPKTALAVLRQARSRISDPDRWIQNNLAARSDDVDHTRSNWISDHHDCFCLVGAMLRSAGLPRPLGGMAKTPEERVALECEAELERTLLERDPTLDPSLAALEAWNDVEGRRHSEVLELLDDTIRRLEAEA